jgi:hypothetical protein
MATTTETPTVTLVPHDKGLALLIDPELLRELGFDEKTPLSVTKDGQTILVRPAVGHPTPEQLKASVERVNAEWGSVLKKLAE